MRSFFVLGCAVLALFGSASCRTSRRPPTALRATHAFTTEAFGCPMASPFVIKSQGERLLMVASTDGILRAFHPADGTLAFAIAMPETPGYVADVTAPPVLYDASHLVVALQHVLPTNYERLDHQVVVVDLEARAIDPTFPTITLGASLPDYVGTKTVDFLPTHAFSRSALAHASVPDRERGFVYVTFGNQRDLQPWHGWVFEIDVDAWSAAGASAATSAVLVTTPESYCGLTNASGSRVMLCGGGIWAPVGPLVREAESGFELLVPTGNGRLDLGTNQYANTLMRTTRGLAFDPGCDPVACAGFDPEDPARACVDSCANLFVPRLAPGEPPVVPESGVCDGMTLLQCYAALDWDLGANSPALVTVPGGPEVVVLPAKDGAVYLFDALHFGTLYDRETVVAPCGTREDTCAADWAGMMVTVPLVAEVDGDPVVVVPTFMFDRTHPAGIVALRIVMRDGAPTLEPFWTAPAFGSTEALAHFRQHPTRASLITIEDDQYVVVVDVAPSGGHGTLYAVRLRDGAIAARAALEGEGNRYTLPLVEGGRIVLASCDSNPPALGHLEALELVRDPDVPLLGP